MGRMLDLMMGRYNMNLEPLPKNLIRKLKINIIYAEAREIR
jgi:hypothetical protein